MRTIVMILNTTLALLAMVVVSSCGTSTANEGKAAEVAPSALPVDVIVAADSSFYQVEVIAGTVMPNRSVEITSELPRKVTAVLFSDGNHVKKGQALYQLDDADIQARLRQVQAEVNMARINERRLSELLRTESVRQEEYDLALTRLQSLIATEDALKVELSKATIRAPFSGIAGISRVFTGSLAAPGVPLVNLQEQSVVKIRFTVSEKHIQAVKQGNTIFFQTALGEQRSHAKIVSSEAGVDLDSRNLVVEAIADNQKLQLRPGMSARVFFNTATARESVVYLPTDALIPGAGGYNVFLVKDGKAKMSPVEIRNRNEKFALVSSGIRDGDTVMVSNLLRAGDGVPVSIASIQ